MIRLAIWSIAGTAALLAVAVAVVYGLVAVLPWGDEKKVQK